VVTFGPAFSGPVFSGPPFSAPPVNDIIFRLFDVFYVCALRRYVFLVARRVVYVKVVGTTSSKDFLVLLTSMMQYWSNAINLNRLKKLSGPQSVKEICIFKTMIINLITYDIMGPTLRRAYTHRE